MPGLSKNSLGKLNTTSLEQALKAHNTAIIGDTLHFETLGVHDLDGTTINPANLLEYMPSTDIFYHVWAAAKQTIEQRQSRGISDCDLTQMTMERLLFELGNAIRDRVDRPHITFVDPRKHDDKLYMIGNARRLVKYCKEKGIHKSQIIVSIPATHAGVAAAKVLEDEDDIHTNLHLVSGLMHAAACAEAGATSITIPVGRLLNSQERKRKTAYEDLQAHPGIETIQSILVYFKLHGLPCKVIGSEFRTLSEIGPLGDFDAICVTKDQADRLRWSQIPITSASADSSASLRARQAQYPTTLLDFESGFLNAMSPDTRNTVTTTLFTALGEMKAQMDELEAIVATEVLRQFELLTLDLRTLYRRRSKSRHPEDENRRRKSHDATPVDKLPKRNLARALNFGDPTPTQDEDEVF